MVKRPHGYTLVALMIGLTVMSILIASVLPLASAQQQRAKEDELIFRGLQYAEGIRLFRRRYGRYPNSLKEMFENRPRTIRKLWKDPITNSDQWGIVGLANAGGIPGVPTPSANPRGGGSGFFRPTPTPTPAPTPLGPPGSPGFGGPASGQQTGPVTGVYSLSKKKSYKIYQGRDEYDEWKFTEQSLTMQPGPPGPGVVR